MRTFRIFASTLIGVCMLLSASAFAQPGERRPQMRTQEDVVSFEPFFRSVGPDSITVDVLYRFRFDFFVFALAADAQTYAARGEVSVEILDSTENSVSRHIESFALSSRENAPGALKRRSWEGFSTFTLPRGRYTALCIVNDKEADNKQMQFRLPLMMRHTRAAASSPLPALAFDRATGVIPCNLGGNALFDSPLYIVAALRPGPPPATASYALMRDMIRGEERVPVQRDTTVGVTVIPHVRLVPALDSVHAVVYRFAPDSMANVGIVELPGRSLQQGRYDLRLRFEGGDTASLRTSFALRWIDMPQSLHDLDFATEAMKYITTDEEYDKLHSGREATRIQAFEQFWKQRDPTPETAYNERLAEYFRRVDYAFTAFRTLKEENGVLTDRGRIYILYGAPAAKDRTLSPENAPREVWRYTALRKLFTFEDTSRQGNYKLIHTDSQ